MSDIKYQDVYTYLSSGRNMKQFIKRCDYGLLIDLQNKLDIHISEWAAQQEKEQEAIQLRNEKRSELLALIVSEGFSPEELNKHPRRKQRGICMNSPASHRSAFVYASQATGNSTLRD